MEQQHLLAQSSPDFKLILTLFVCSVKYMKTQVTFFCPKISFVAIYNCLTNNACLSQNNFVRIYALFVSRTNLPKILPIEKEGQITGMNMALLFLISINTCNPANKRNKPY